MNQPSIYYYFTNISLYIFAGYRLMPGAANLCIFYFLTFVEPAVDKLSHDIKNLKISNIDQDKNIISYD